MVSEEEIAALGAHGFFLRADAAPGCGGWLPALKARAQDGRPAGLGRAAVSDRSERGDLICWLDRDDAAVAAGPVAFFDGLRDALNERAYLGLRDYELQLARYPGGGARYARHRDAFRDAPGSKRRLTAILYFNPDWTADDGGLLRLHSEAGAVDVEPRLGQLVVFLSERVEHEVLPVHRPRLALTAWFHGP